MYTHRDGYGNNGNKSSRCLLEVGLHVKYSLLCFKILFYFFAKFNNKFKPKVHVVLMMWCLLQSAGQEVRPKL